MHKQTTIAAIAIAHQMSVAAVEAAIGRNVAAGLIEVWGVNEHGEPLYQTTAKGRARVEALLQGGPVPADGESD